MRRLIGCLVGIAVVLLPTPTFASGLSFGVEGGLDKKTRKFLDAYPNKVRMQVVGLLRDALPLYKDGVVVTFDKLNESIQLTFGEMECAQSTLPITAEESARGIRSAFSLWGRRYGSRTATNLEEQYDEMRAKLDGKISPQSVSLAYLDVLGSAHATKCYYRRQPEEALAGLKKTEADIFVGQRIWNLLINFACDTPRACYQMVYRFDVRLIAEADPRDVAGARAKVRLSRMPIPDLSSVNGFDLPGWNLFGDRFDLNAYESRVWELMAIQFDISAQSLLRAQTAVGRLDVLDRQLSSMDTRAKTLADAFNGSSSEALTSAFSNNAGGMLLADINGLAVQAPLSISDADIVLGRQQTTLTKQQRLASSVSKLNAGYAARLKRLRLQEQIRSLNRIRIG